MPPGTQNILAITLVMIMVLVKMIYRLLVQLPLVSQALQHEGDYDMYGYGYDYDVG